MNNPIISWTNSDLVVLGSTPEVPATVQFNNGAYGSSVLADTDSAEIQLAITNNFVNGTAATDACFDMKKCSVTTKDTTGGMNEQVVQEKWIRLKSDSLGESDFTEIGAHLDGGTWVEDSHNIGCGDATVGANNISGAANDGTEAGTGKTNIARFTLKAHPSTTATPTTHNFKLRVVYTYGIGDDEVAVTGISTDPTSGSVAVGSTLQINTTVAPENASNKTVTYNSSNTGIATVDENGIITGVAAGEATITVTSSADNTKTATFTVTVTA